MNWTRKVRGFKALRKWWKRMRAFNSLDFPGKWDKWIKTKLAGWKDEP